MFRSNKFYRKRHLKLPHLAGFESTSHSVTKCFTNWAMSRIYINIYIFESLVPMKSVIKCKFYNIFKNDLNIFVWCSKHSFCQALRLTNNVISEYRPKTDSILIVSTDFNPIYTNKSSIHNRRRSVFRQSINSPRA